MNKSQSPFRSPKQDKTIGHFVTDLFSGVKIGKMSGDQVVHYKIFLCAAGYEPEIRRITIDKDISNNYFYLKQKILAIFPTLKDVAFTISWKDCEGDIIRICTDDELMIALREMETLDFKKIYVNATPPGKEGPLHPDVVCDGCEQHVQGFRYKCIVCYDYDLCPDCERSQVHPDHPMLRIPLPLSSEMPFGRRFSRDISRMSKHLERLFQQNGDNWSDRKAKGDYSKTSHSENKKHKMKFCPRNEMHNFIHSIVMNQLEKFRGSSGDTNVVTSNNELKQDSNHPESQPSSSATNVYPILDEQKNFVNILTNGLNSFLDPLGIDVVVEVDPVKEETTEQQTESQQSASGADKRRTDGASSSGAAPQPSNSEVTSTTTIRADPVVPQTVNTSVPLVPEVSGSVSYVGVASPSLVGIPTPLSAIGVPPVAQGNVAPVQAATILSGTPIDAVLNPTPVTYNGPIPTANLVQQPIQSDLLANVRLPHAPINSAQHPASQPTQSEMTLLDNSWTVVNPGMIESMYQQPAPLPVPIATPAVPPPLSQPAPPPSQSIYPEIASNLSSKEALIFMLQLGYEDEDWLRRLIEGKKGNIQEILQFLSPVSKPSNPST